MALSVNLNIGDLLAAVPVLGAMADQAERLVGSAKQAKAAGGSAAGGGKKDPAYFIGPNQKLLQIQEQMNRAQKEGNELALADLRILEFRAKRSKELGERRLAQGKDALTAPGLLDLFQTMNGLLKDLKGGGVSGTFKALGAGVQLFHQEAPGGLNVEQKLGDVLGKVSKPAETAATSQAAATTEAAAGAEVLAEGAGAAGASLLELATGPVGWAILAITLLVSGAKLLGDGIKWTVEQMKQGAANLRAMSAAQTVSGGTAGEVGALAAAGLSPGEVAGLGASLRGRLSGDAFGQMAGAQLGLSPTLPQEFGDQDNARIVRETAYALGDMTDQTEQLRRANMLGVASYLPLFKAMARHRAEVEDDADLLAKVFDPEHEKAAEDLAFEMNRLQTSWGAFQAVLSKPFLRLAAFGAEKLADGLNLGVRMAELLEEGMERLLRMAGALGDTLLHPDHLKQNLQAAWDAVTKPIQAEDDARKDHADAMREHARALKEGMRGGGDRARGALHGIGRHSALSHAMEEGMRLGGAWAF